MTSTRTKPIITIAILLIVLAVLSVVSLLTSQLGGFARGARPQRTFNGTPVPGGNAQGGNGGGFQGGDNGGGGGFQGGNGGGGNFQGGNGGGGNFQGRGGGGFNAFAITRQLGLSPQIFFFINIGIAVIGIVLLLLCAYGVWKQKKKALNGAIVLAILFLLAALPALFTIGGRFINIPRLVMDVLQLGAAAAIVVMGILPSVRDSVD